MRTRLAIKIHTILERYFPERRVFLRSDNDTRFIRLRPSTQLFAFLGASAIIAWSIIATSILVMDNIGAGNFREQAKREPMKTASTPSPPNATNAPKRQLPHKSGFPLRWNRFR